ncbi:MAG TPA: ribonuclease R [Bacteroidales bacterium]|nr:ribonuclease R [Bacteroidales bacterium]HPS72489.1 ribonuclease R [Bacteroidales bacterium]
MKDPKNSNLGNKIIEALSLNNKEKLNYKQIASKVGIFDQKGRGVVQKIILDFLDAKILLTVGKGKYKLNPKYLTQETTGNNFVIGKIQINRSGTAFVVTERKDDDDIFIAEANLSNALHSDIVKVMVFPARQNRKPEGQVVEIIERSKKQLVGTIQINRGLAFFVPDTLAFRRDILIPGRLLNGAKSGEKVVIAIVDWEAGTRNPIGKVIHILGNPGDNEVEMNSILAEFDFPLKFPDNVLKECEKISLTIPEEEIKNRRDFRNITTFTIDPEDAKDFDDAISYEKLENGLHRVGVHIADVSYYVRNNTPIDNEAYLRGTSVYLVDRTIPMLPEILSNQLCSLRPNEDKLCYSAVFDLDDQAKVHHEWFGRTVINSDRRFNYDEAQTIIETGKGDYAETVLQIHELSQLLRKERFLNHAINFDTEEVRFKLDENSKPIGVYLKVQREANFLIEEMMLLANKKVAEKIGKRTAKNKEIKTFIYRIHDEPINDRVEQFKSFVSKLGFELHSGSRKQFTDSLNQMFEKAKDKNEYNLLGQLSIRMMARAIYSTENIGHYGLAFPFYTHFTSPIRRYPDLMVHRLLEAYLNNEPSVKQNEYDDYCKHCSLMEQKATEAERASVKYKQAEYLADKIGQVFEATVSGIAKWGVFAELKESKCEGLIPMKNFTDDFYYIDEDNYTLIGLHHGNNIRFGDTIKVKVMEVDLQRKSMTFGIC